MSQSSADPAAQLDIAVPDDWHVHLRDDHMLAAVTPLTARWFRRALVMPNLVPPITDSVAAAAYRERILAAAGPEARADFEPVMVLYVTDGVSIDDVRAGVEAGVVIGLKYYPAGATTNSDAGGTSMLSFRPLLEFMAAEGIPLLVHAESTDPTIDIFDRERAFLDRELVPLAAELPELRVTVEHLSTAEGVEFVRDHPQVAGTITPHHLSCDRSDLLANGMRPDLYCKPVINSPQNRKALVAAATSGSPSFFLGTDSAPHPSIHKYAANVRAGIFCAPFALPVVAEVFHRAGALDRLEAFTSLNGCRHYGFEASTERLRLTRAADEVIDAEAANDPDGGPAEELVTADGARVRIFGVAEARRWTVAEVAGSDVGSGATSGASSAIG
ncbi:MAG: dihydroorotase [Actinomycetota bacterium]